MKKSFFLLTLLRRWNNRVLRNVGI